MDIDNEVKNALIELEALGINLNLGLVSTVARIHKCLNISTEGRSSNKNIASLFPGT